MTDNPAPNPQRPRRRFPGILVGGAVAVGLAIVVALAFLGGSGSPEPGPAAGADDSGQQPGADAAADPSGLGDQDGEGAAVEGRRVPSDEFEMFDGSTATLSDWEGQPLVLNFWASWCPPCVGEMGDAFEPAHQEHGDQVAFLGVNVQDNRDLALDVVEQTGVTYDLADDPDGQLFAQLGGFGMPTTVFISADGKVVDTHSGALTREQLDAEIDDLLAEEA